MTLEYGERCLYKYRHNLCGILIIIVTFGFNTPFTQATPSVRRGHDAEEHDDLSRQLSKENDPALAWLLTFPSSGTTFTTLLMATATRCATANNIGNTVSKSRGLDKFLFVQGHLDSVPVSPGHPNGPFKFEQDLPLPPPKSFMLTKTHCTGFCFECAPPEYTFSSDDFFNSCRTALSFIDRKQTPHYYDYKRVKKVVHLLRNPFDNVVSRFHHYYRKQHTYKANKTRKNKEYHHFILNVAYSGHGFLQWCRYADDMFLTSHRRNFDEETFDLLTKVPCHAEFIKYVNWHNLAFQVVKDKLSQPGEEIPTMVLKYEDFAYQFGDTFQSLLSFLNLTHRGSIKPFNYSTYISYYSEDMKLNVKRLLKKLASEETWEHIKHYMPDEQT